MLDEGLVQIMRSICKEWIAYIEASLSEYLKLRDRIWAGR